MNGKCELLALQEERRSRTDELTGSHDSYSVSQKVCLVHTVSRYDDGSTLLKG